MMKINNIKVDIVYLGCSRTPYYATEGSAGCDLHSSRDIIIHPNDTEVIPTGIKLGIPKGYEGQVRSRSGLSINGIVVANSPGTLDSDFTGEVKVILRNTGERPFEVKIGDRIAQLVFAPIVHAYFLQVDELDNTDRGEGGFGSTGVS